MIITALANIFLLSDSFLTYEAGPFKNASAKIKLIIEIVNNEVNVYGDSISDGSENVANIKKTPLSTKHTIALV